MTHYQEGKIKDVFQENLEEELRNISNLIEEFNFISMDTEFPGIVFPLNQHSQYTSKNIENFIRDSNFNQNNKTSNQYSEAIYKNIKMNVDNLKMIQIGITLSNEYGQFPEDISTWQFNFKFDLGKETYLSESINLLETAGIDFKKFNEKGINMDYFSELFITSGLILNENVKWVTFHGGYDFAYLIQALSNQSLPEDENVFNDLLQIYYCNFYDVRQMIKNVTWLKGSLSRIATDLDIKRIGQTHQAGSDSLVTAKVFFRLLSNFNDHVDLYGDKNKLFGFTYKVVEEFEWNMNYSNNFNNYNQLIGMNNGVHTMNSMNNVNNINVNNINNGKQIKTQSANNIVYFNNYNYPNNMNMFYGNNPNFNTLYPNIDYNNYMASVYNSGTSSIKP